MDPSCFHFLTIVNTAAINMSAQISVRSRLSNILGTYPEVKLLDHMVYLCYTEMCLKEDKEETKSSWLVNSLRK